MRSAFMGIFKGREQKGKGGYGVKRNKSCQKPLSIGLWRQEENRSSTFEKKGKGRKRHLKKKESKELYFR